MLLRSFWQTWRTLRESPGFTVVAVLTLALAIGLNTSLFSFTRTVFLAEAPFPRPEELHLLAGRIPQRDVLLLSKPELDELRAQENPHVVREAVVADNLDNLALPGQPAEDVQAQLAEPQLFTLTETPPLLGRVFTAEEAVAGRDQVVLITESFWIERFGGKPDVLQQSLRLNGKLYQIIGVLPKAYESEDLFFGARLFRPLVYWTEVQQDRSRREFAFYFRLAPGSTAEQALSHYVPVAERWAKEQPSLYPSYRLQAPLAGKALGQVNQLFLWLLTGLALAVLAIACANLANLQLIRTQARLRDLALRSALGASRTTLIAHQLRESLLLALLGGLGALLVAEWSNSALRSFLDHPEALRLDLEVLLFAAVITVLTGLGFGLIPAWLASRVDVSLILKSGARGTTTGKRSRTFRRTLVVLQLALAATLVATAGGMALGIHRVVNHATNWDSDLLLTANLQISEVDYPNEAAKNALHDAVLRRVRQIPGVEAATLSSDIPFRAEPRPAPCLREGMDARAKDLPRLNYYMVKEDFFTTLGLTLHQGRALSAEDRLETRPVVVVNRSLAEAFWPQEDPLGKRLGVTPGQGDPTWYEVVGVVEDMDPMLRSGHPSTRFQAFLPMTQGPWAWFQILLRSKNPGAQAEPLRRAVMDVNPDLATRWISTEQDLRQGSTRFVSLINRVIIAFALLGLVLASLGLAGVASYEVTQRLGEFGIRLALGCSPRELLSLVLRQSLLLTGAGLLLGLGGAFWLSTTFPPRIARMITLEPWVLVSTFSVLATVGLLAAWWPARRAARTDPLATLRSE